MRRKAMEKSVVQRLRARARRSRSLTLVKGVNLKAPRFTTDGPFARQLDWGGYEVTTGIGPHLFVADRQAVADMVDLISCEQHIGPVQAYMLCCVCGDVRISEIVDRPNSVVSYYFPRVVFG